MASEEAHVDARTRNARQARSAATGAAASAAPGTAANAAHRLDRPSLGRRRAGKLRVVRARVAGRPTGAGSRRAPGVGGRRPTRVVEPEASVREEDRAHCGRRARRRDRDRLPGGRARVHGPLHAQHHDHGQGRVVENHRRGSGSVDRRGEKLPAERVGRPTWARPSTAAA